MPNWNDIVSEIQHENFTISTRRAREGSHVDCIRRNYLEKYHELTGRNVVVYYSGWLNKPGVDSNLSIIDDSDKTGFMTAFHNLDKKKGLDLFLHSPGGNIAATESIVDYIRSLFGTNVRAVIPQLAMSAGTMIACSAKEILMGKHSNLGPIDPHVGGGLAALGILEEFETAANEMAKDPLKAYVWQPILTKYHPSLIIECQKAVEWSEEIVNTWLSTGMFKGVSNKAKRDKVVSGIVTKLMDKQKNYVHARHISMEKAKNDIKLKIVELEKDKSLQDAVLSLHHACIATLVYTPAIKIIDNHLGAAYIRGIVPAS